MKSIRLITAICSVVCSMGDSANVAYDTTAKKVAPQDLKYRGVGFTATVGITNEAATANSISAFGADKELKSVALSGLTFDGTTLTATGGGSIASTTSVLKGNGSGDAVAAVSGTDFAPATSGTAILKGNGSGGFNNAASGTDYAPATSGSAILKGNGSGGFSSAVASTDYIGATSGSAIQKANGSGGLTAATSGTDYQSPLSTVTGGFYHGAILTPWVDTNSNVSLQWRKAPQVWEFSGAAGEWTTVTANSGSATVAAASVDTAEGGLVSFATGTLTNGTAGLRVSAQSIIATTNSASIIFKVKTPSALSTDADGYQFYAGFSDAAGDVAPVDGAYFVYSHSINSGAWLGRTSNNSVTTDAGSGSAVTVAVDTWYLLRVDLSLTVANFFVSSDDGATWVFAGFASSNIPSTTARSMGFVSHLRKVGGSVGTTARTAYLGRCELWPNRAN